MSSGFRGFRAVSVCLLSVGATAVAAVAAPPVATRPAGESGLRKLDMRPAGVQPGVVQQALRPLYTIPRSAGAQPGASVALGDAPAASRSGGTKPIPRWSKNLAAPQQSEPAAADAPVRSNVPDADDLRAAGITDPRPPIRDQDGPYTGQSAGLRGWVGGPGYGLGGQRLPTHRRRWNDYRYFDGRPSQYGYGYEDYYGDDYTGESYRFGFNRGYDRGRFDKVGTERQESLLKNAITAMDRGLVAFREGRYRDAVDAFRLASETNQGDPTAHIYAGHALFAVGRYHDGVKYIRRAMELQPRIAYLNYDLRGDYRDRREFDRQLADLRGALELSPRDSDRLFMLGYILYYSGQREEAYPILERLCRLNPEDTVSGRLMDNAKPADVAIAPRPGAAPQR